MLKVTGLNKSYRKDERVLHEVNFYVNKGDFLGIIGGSGCGKTTLALCICGLLQFESGNIEVNNKNLNELNEKLKNIWLRSHLQYIFQNSIDTLHPKKTIKKIFQESIDSLRNLTGKKYSSDFESLLSEVDLPVSSLNKYCGDFSGGERQRITIARSLLAEPALLIADEPISNLDVTTQARILNLFRQINNNGVTVVFITHDLAAAQYTCNSFIFINEGRIIESGASEEIFRNPKSDFTKQLIYESKI